MKVPSFDLCDTKLHLQVSAVQLKALKSYQQADLVLRLEDKSARFAESCLLSPFWCGYLLGQFQILLQRWKRSILDACSFKLTCCSKSKPWMQHYQNSSIISLWMTQGLALFCYLCVCECVCALHTVHSPHLSLPLDLSQLLDSLVYSSLSKLACS